VTRSASDWAEKIRRDASVSSKVSSGSKEFSARLETRCFWGRDLKSKTLFPASRLLASVGSDVGGKVSLIGIEEEQNSVGSGRSVSIEVTNALEDSHRVEWVSGEID
jgi:hypothetical protein